MLTVRRGLSLYCTCRSPLRVVQVRRCFLHGPMSEKATLTFQVLESSKWKVFAWYMQLPWRSEAHNYLPAIVERDRLVVTDPKIHPLVKIFLGLIRNL
jgi:hypothetical protein